MNTEFVITQDDVINLQTGDITIQCPHCLRYTVPILVTRPIFKQLVTLRPTTLGLVCLCPACHSNIYLQTQIQYTFSSASVLRISSDFRVMEKANSFSVSGSVPDTVVTIWKEAWHCYIGEYWNAFVAMARKMRKVVDQDLAEKRSLQGTEEEDDLTPLIKEQEEVSSTDVALLDEATVNKVDETDLTSVKPVFRMHSTNWLDLFLDDWGVQFRKKINLDENDTLQESKEDTDTTDIDEEYEEIWLLMLRILKTNQEIPVVSQEEASLLFTIMEDLLNQVYIRPFAVDVMKAMPPNKT